jgi:hypothetical protein
MAVAWLVAEPVPDAMLVTARLATATEGAAAKMPARPRGRRNSPTAAKAQTTVPPAIAFAARIRIGLTSLKRARGSFYERAANGKSAAC